MKSVPVKGTGVKVKQHNATLGANTKFSMGSGGRAKPAGCDKVVKARGNPPGSK